MHKLDTIRLLKNHGHRITRLRKELVGIFSETTVPLSVSEILHQITTGNNKADKTTIYRELAFFLSIGLINELYINPKKVYYESSALKHHHHLICKNCNTIKDIFIGNEFANTEMALEKENNFKIVKHSLEFFGLCSNCH